MGTQPDERAPRLGARQAGLRLGRHLRRHEPALAATGLLGIGLAGLCAAAIVARGSPRVAPEGDLLKPLAFDLAIGIWVLTLAVLLPYAGAGARARAIWRNVLAGAILYFYFAETYPTLDGYDPRFSGASPASLKVVSALFGLDSLLVIGLFVVFASWFYRGRAAPGHPGIRLGVRWASVATLLAFGIGVWMIAMEGRRVGAGGSALWPHALGFHALQAVPLVGWLADRRAGSRWLVHAAGGLWLVATVGALAQSAGGRPPAEATPAVGLAATALLGWGLVLVRAIARPDDRSAA